jgi:hypothetical protein
MDESELNKLKAKIWDVITHTIKYLDLEYMRQNIYYYLFKDIEKSILKEYDKELRQVALKAIGKALIELNNSIAADIMLFFYDPENDLEEILSSNISSKYTE